MSAPGHIGGTRLERMKKADLFEFARAGGDCGCDQASVLRELLRRDKLKQAKRERAKLRRVALRR
jgi:hypothetical protein